MIKSITVTNFLGHILKMELASPEKSGFIIKEITGLGPCKADINSKELATSDGSVYNSARVNSRNIVMKLLFMHNPTIEDMRQKSYKFFPLKQKLKIVIETDNRLCETYGYVESNEPDIWSENSGCQISIVCPDPYFHSSGEQGTQVTVFNGVEDNFEFPFSNESLTENLLEFGIATYSTERVIYYTGDGEIGMTIDIVANGEISMLTIYNMRTREFFKIDTDRLAALTGHGIIQGDHIVVSTIRGEKSITLTRDGIQYNILNAVDRNSTWLTLTRGDNLIAYTAEGGGSNLEFRVDNKTIYEGV